MSILQELLKLREDADAHLVRDIKDALENGDDYKAKALAKLASSPAKRNELMKLIDDEMHKVEEGQKSDAFQDALAELVRDEEDPELSEAELKALIDKLAKKYKLSASEKKELALAAEGPIGY